MIRCTVALLYAASVLQNAHGTALLRASPSKSGSAAAANESAADQSPSTNVQTPSLPAHNDIFSLIKKAEENGKKELKTIASARPGTEHRVDKWADLMIASTERAVEKQLASNTNLHLHMKGWITDLADEAQRMDNELKKRLTEAQKPRPIPVSLEHHKPLQKTDTRTKWQKIEDKSDEQLRDAIQASQSVAAQGVKDDEGKYTSERQEKYWNLSDQLYKLETAMRSIAPTLKQAKTTLDLTKGDMTAQHESLRDTVHHVENLSKTVRSAITNVNQIGKVLSQ